MLENYDNDGWYTQSLEENLTKYKKENKLLKDENNKLKERLGELEFRMKGLEK